MHDAFDPLDAHQPGGDLHGHVDRDGKADALGAGPHGDVDADHFAIDIQQRPARIARVDAGIGLNQVLILLGVADVNGAVQGADDAARDGVFVAIGVADGDDRFARHQIAGSADRDHRQFFFGRDLDDRQVGVWIVRNQRGDEGLAAGQRHLDFFHPFDHVMIRDDVAALIDDHAGAHAVDVLRRVAAADILVGRRDGLLTVDVDDRWPGLLDRPDRGGTPQLGAGGHAHSGHLSRRQREAKAPADRSSEREVSGFDHEMGVPRGFGRIVDAGRSECRQRQ